MSNKITVELFEKYISDVEDSYGQITCQCCNKGIVTPQFKVRGKWRTVTNKTNKRKLAEAMFNDHRGLAHRAVAIKKLKGPNI
jgi:hypothetical protein